MKAHIYKSVLGAFAVADGKIIAFEPFPSDVEKIVKKLFEDTPEEKRIIKKLKKYEIISGTPPDLDVLLKKAGIARDEYNKLLKKVTIASAGTKIGIFRRDKMIIQAVEAREDVEEALNIISERIREWYSLHFPELDSAVYDHEEFVELIKKHGSKDNFPEEFGGESSLGADLPGDDIAILKQFASQIADIYRFRDKLDSYIESAMEDIAPNLSLFAGSAVGAKLLSQAKGLENLAKMPASRLQILGAQKAMFKHIKKGAPPPKHGVIFQHPAIKTAKWWQRGKIARSFSGKAAIAAKADAFSGKYIADELKRGFKKRLKEISEKYPEAPQKMRIIRYTPEKKKRRKK